MDVFEISEGLPVSHSTGTHQNVGLANQQTLHEYNSHSNQR